jgi:hypothetical protein
MHIHLDEEQFMVNIDHINHETKFNRMDASSYLEPETFANWVHSMFDGCRVRECTTFEELASKYEDAEPDCFQCTFKPICNPVLFQPRTDHVRS